MLWRCIRCRCGKISAVSDYLMGIDLGTTSVKAGVFTPVGNVLETFGESYPTTRKDGGVCEQDPRDWTRLIDVALKRFEAAGLRGHIAGAALTSQVNTHVFVDRIGCPLMPAITWQDTRAAYEAAELDDQLKEEDKIAWLGAPIPVDASHPLARMLWVQRHAPEIWDKTRFVLLPKDFAIHGLTGELATDPLSNIGLVGPDGHFVPQILDLVPGAADRMPPIRNINETIGKSPDGTPFVTATMDGWVGLLGTGVCREGAFAYLSGTSEILGVASHEVTNEPGVVVFAEAEGLRLHAGPTQSGGASQQWFCNLTGLSIPEMIELVAGTQRRHPTPLFLPHLAGERAPLWNVDLRGVFLGIESGMQISDFARAIYEGVALSARHVLDALEASSATVPETVSCGGGGFRSDPWGQIRADILCKRLERLVIYETGVVGAVCLAAAAIGMASSLEEAHRPFERFDQVWEPDPNTLGFHEDLFGIYKEAIETNETLGKRLVDLKP